MTKPVRVVFDCNIYLQAFGRTRGPAAACLNSVRDGHSCLFLSEYVLSELWDLLGDRELILKFPTLTTERMEEFVSELRRIAVFVDPVPSVYVHPYDPDDSHYVDLAAATNSRLIVSRDRHLLNLMDAHRKEGQEFMTRFPALRVLDPPGYLRELRQIERQQAGEPEHTGD